MKKDYLSKSAILNNVPEEDFVVFSDLAEVSGPLPTIKTKSDFCLDAEQEIADIKRFSKRAQSCLEKAIRDKEQNLDSFSWAMYLYENVLTRIRRLAADRLNETDLSVFPIDMENGSPKYKVSGDTVQLILPLLVPKRKAGQHTSYYCDRFTDFLKGHKIPESLRTEKVAIVIVHCYSKEHIKWSKRDHDNLEIKWIIDALNDNFFIDDGPLRTSLYQHSVASESDHTEVFLMPLQQLPTFLSRMIPEWDSR